MQCFNYIQDCGKQLGFKLQPGVYETDKYYDAYFTLEIVNSENVRLTVGASWENRIANEFDKESLQDMINDLQFICDNMEKS